MANPYRMDGQAFNPFLVPVPLPTSEPFESATNCIHFNDDWFPLVMGALKVLTRPEIYDSDDKSAIELAIKRAHTLFNQDTDCGECPGFFVTTCHDHIEFDESFVSLEEIEDCGCIGHGQEYEFVVATNPLTGSARLGICCKEYPTNALCGGWVDRLEIFSDDPLAATPLFTLVGEDCFGVPLDTLVVTSAYVRSGFTMKHLEIVAGYSFRLKVRISGPVVCIEA